MRFTHENRSPSGRDLESGSLRGGGADQTDQKPTALARRAIDLCAARAARTSEQRNTSQDQDKTTSRRLDTVDTFMAAKVISSPSPPSAWLKEGEAG